MRLRVAGVSRAHASKNGLYGRKRGSSCIWGTRLSKTRTRAEHSEVFHLVEPRPRLIVVLLRKRFQDFFKRNAERNYSEAESGGIAFASLYVTSLHRGT